LPSSRKRGEDDLSPEGTAALRASAPADASPRSIGETLCEEYTAFAAEYLPSRRALMARDLPSLAKNVLLPHPEDTHKVAGYDLLLSFAAQSGGDGWGQRGIAAATGVMESLLSGEALSSLQLAEARTSVLRAMVTPGNKGAARGALGDALFAAVETRARAGVIGNTRGTRRSDEVAVYSEHL